LTFQPGARYFLMFHPFYFPLMQYEKYWFRLQKKKKNLQIFTFQDFLYLKFRLSRGVAGVAVRALVEICVDDISAVLRATDFRLPFISWAGLMHLILRILKFWNL
jgi:hypothetical protein